jgi:hypothetical protein
MNIDYIMKAESLAQHEEKHEEKKEAEPTAVEVMERETKKVCCAINKDVRCACHYCLRCWSLSLNGCEGCCSILSATCLFLSSVALGCNKCLEQMDCDGH